MDEEDGVSATETCECCFHEVDEWDIAPCGSGVSICYRCSYQCEEDE